MIPAEAVEAAMAAFAQAPYEPATTLEQQEINNRAQMTLSLEAAAPHMLAGATEFGIFRKGGDWHDAPMENWIFTTRERAEESLRKFIDGESWLEVRSRTVVPWKVTTP